MTIPYPFWFFRLLKVLDRIRSLGRVANLLQLGSDNWDRLKAGLLNLKTLVAASCILLSQIKGSQSKSILTPGMDDEESSSSSFFRERAEGLDFFWGTDTISVSSVSIIPESSRS